MINLDLNFSHIINIITRKLWKFSWIHNLGLISYVLD